MSILLSGESSFLHHSFIIVIKQCLLCATSTRSHFSKKMGSRSVCIQRVVPPCFDASQVKIKTVRPFFVNTRSKRRGSNGVRCSSIVDFIGGDLVKPDIGRWLQDVEEHKAIAIYTPHEGGYEGRYLNRLKMQGYYFLDLSARGLGDPETTLLKNYPVCPVCILSSIFSVILVSIKFCVNYVSSLLIGSSWETTYSKMVLSTRS